ncbi:MAG: hypothetical protein ACKOU6_14050, partial [Planctomycetota bacterium]
MMIIFFTIIVLLIISGIVIAAEEARQKQVHAEEEMAFTNTDPSGEFEYKIIRSETGAFKNPAKLRAALAEEARAGWDLLEKFDDSRVRLRRSRDCRKDDAGLEQDPYRTTVGMTQAGLLFSILIGIFLGFTGLIA